ncbi:hypothetical protein BJY52DRAFT_1184424 [Lactarius psammicola]|nr:hypothetical protein BJY52DRAFT_1184424 [Lactarius psammicola]
MAGVVSKECCFDSHTLGPADTIAVVLQVKNELGSSHREPTIDISAFYTQSLKHLTNEVRSRYFFSALGIVIIGQCRSAIDYSTWPTPLLPTTTESGSNRVKPALLNALGAACVLRRHIFDDTNTLTTKNVIRFRIRVETCQGLTRYPIDDTGDKVIVKFTLRYFQNYTRSAQSHVPQLLGYGNIPGGWRVVVMELIDQEETNLQVFAPRHLSTWSEDLKLLVKAFHDKEL